MAPNYHSEMRQNKITTEWVACAPQRSTRPRKTASPSTESSEASPSVGTPVEGCPFCPGHEDQLPSILWQLDTDDDRPWKTRAVPNKYSALTTAREPRVHGNGLYERRSSYGRQEVIIDTPAHNQGFGQLPVDQIDAVLQTYLARYHALRHPPHNLYPFVFRNHGATAGASLPHPHSQVIATPFPPPRIEDEEEAARSRYEETRRCPYCEMIEKELDEELRIVWTNEDFVVFVPFAARVPYEMWILPRTHEPEFGHLAVPQRSTLASALHQATRRLDYHLDDPDYNFFVRTALEYESQAPHLHWSVRLQPRTTVNAGFELSTGIHINPSIPERDASVLRNDG